MARIDYIGLQVYSTLNSRTPLTSKEIAERTRIPIEMVEYYLKRFESLALVTKVIGWKRNPHWRPGPIKMDV